MTDPIYKIKAGRIITVPVTTYVGEKGTIFYDEVIRLLRLSDGVTPGGIPIGGGGGAANITVAYQGNTLTNSVSSMNFVGSQVYASNVGDAVTITVDNFILDGGDPDQTYICGPLPALIGPEWDGSNCVNLGGVT